MIVGLALAALAVGALLGCGGDEEGDSGSAGAAVSVADPQGVLRIDNPQAIIDEQLQPVGWHAPGPAFEPDPDVSGTIHFIPSTTEVFFFQQVIRGLNEAASRFDMEVVAVEARGQLTEVVRGIRQAIGQDAAAIVIAGVQPEALAAPIKEASDAGIPVIVMGDQGGGPDSPKQEAPGIFAGVDLCYECAGRVLAALAVTESDQDVSAVSFTLPDAPDGRRQSLGFIEGLAEFCPDCQVEEVEIPVAEVTKQIGPAVSAALSDPEVNYLVPVFSFQIHLMRPAIDAANADDRVTAISHGTDPEILKAVRRGGIVGGILGSPEGWHGWAVFDQVLRALSDEPPAPSAIVPTRLFTEANVGTIDVEASPDEWFGLNFRAEFMKLWGLAEGRGR